MSAPGDGHIIEGNARCRLVDVNLHTDQFALRFANGTAPAQPQLHALVSMPGMKALVPEPR